MRISKNISRGGLIKDMCELYSLSCEKKSVVVYIGGHHFIRPAAFMIHWSLCQLLRTKIYHSIKDSEIQDAEFENETENPK